MTLDKFYSLISGIQNSPKYFLAVNYGCRVNAAEINQMSQILINEGFTPNNPPNVILVNTCSITQKGEKESLGKIRQLHRQFPKAIIFVTGCAATDKIKNISHIFTFDNQFKEKLLKNLNCAYTPKIKDKFSHTHRFLLKIQSGCTQYCSYCTVPYKRSYLWSLPIDKAIDTINQAVNDGYDEIILTGINLDQYQFGFAKLIENILISTNIKLISFGSLTISTLNRDLLKLYQNPKYYPRLSHFVHVPIQSGSDKILKLMNRPYSQKEILKNFKLFQANLPDLKWGTDIIVGFPGESEKDFLETIKLCQKIGFTKIHTFRFSPRLNTPAKFLYSKSIKIPSCILKQNSQKIRQLVV